MAKSQHAFSVDAVLSDGSRVDAVWEDFNATPVDLYAKRGDFLSAKAKIQTFSESDSPLIDDSLPSYPIRVEEKEDIQEEASKPSQSNFEQISLFDELMGNDEDK